MILSRLARAARSSLFGGIAVLAGACSSQDAGPKYPDVNSFCNGRASAECNAEVLGSCGSPDQATCIAKRQAACVAAKPPTGTYAPASAESCINVVSSAYGDAKLTLDESNAIKAACDPVFDGAGAKNAACQVDANCQQSTGLRCVLSAGSTSGTCQIPQQVMGGGSCASPDQQCVSGYHCGSTAHCDIDAALNESCATLPCAPGLLCSSAGTCVSKAQDGTVCASDGECLHGICNRASATAMGLCVSQISLAPTEPFCVDTR
jgi:hypothetical protein